MTRMNRRDTASDLSPPDFLFCANWKGYLFIHFFWHDNYFMFLLYLQVTTYRIQGTRSQQEVDMIYHQKKTAMTAL